MQSTDKDIVDFALRIKQLLTDNCIRAVWNGRPKTDGVWYVREMLKAGATEQDIIQAASNPRITGWYGLQQEAATVSKMRKIREQQTAIPAPVRTGLYGFLLSDILKGRR